MKKILSKQDALSLNTTIDDEEENEIGNFITLEEESLEDRFAKTTL